MKTSASLPLVCLVSVGPLFGFTETSVDFDAADALGDHFNVSPTANITHSTSDGFGSVKLGTTSLTTDLNLAIFRTGYTLSAGETYSTSFRYTNPFFSDGYLSVGYTTTSEVNASQGGDAWDSTPPDSVASVFSTTAYAWRNNVGDPVAGLAGQGFADLSGVSLTARLSMVYEGAGVVRLSMVVINQFVIGGESDPALSQTITLTNGAFVEGATIRPFFGGDSGFTFFGESPYVIDDFKSSVGVAPVTIGSGQSTSLNGSSPQATINNNGGTATVTAPTTVATLTGTGAIQVDAPLTLGNASGAFNGTISGDGGVVVTGGNYSLGGTINAPLTVGGDTTLELDASVSGPVEVVGGTVNLRDGTSLSGGFEAEGTEEQTAEVSIASGESVSFAGRFQIGAHASFKMKGTLIAQSEASHLAVLNTVAQVMGVAQSTVTFVGSTVSVGSSPGLFTVTESLSFDDNSTLQLEIGGHARGTEFDAIDVGDTLTLAGDLQLTLINGFTPQAGDIFNVIDAGTFVGAFATYDLPDLAEGLAWDRSTFATDGVLRVVTTAIPEPSQTAIVFALAGLGLALRRRNRPVTR